MTTESVFGENSESIVRNSKMFPFRFYQAFKACGSTGINQTGRSRTRAKKFDIGRGSLLDSYDETWLNEAIDTSAQNLPDTLENTFTAVDLSGSMDNPISANSDMDRAEIATLFGAMLMKRNSDVGAFGSDFAFVESSPSSIENTGTLTIASNIYKLSEEVGNATDGWKALKWATEKGIEYDRFVMFTDEQIWDSTSRGLFSSDSGHTVKEWWDKYQNRVNPDAQLYIIDLASYGDLSMPEGYNNVHQISGWSSNVIDFIDKNEKASDVVSNIEEIGPDTY